MFSVALLLLCSESWVSELEHKGVYISLPRQTENVSYRHKNCISKTSHTWEHRLQKPKYLTVQKVLRSVLLMWCAKRLYSSCVQLLVTHVGFSFSDGIIRVKTHTDLREENWFLLLLFWFDFSTKSVRNVEMDYYHYIKLYCNVVTVETSRHDIMLSAFGRL